MKLDIPIGKLRHAISKDVLIGYIRELPPHIDILEIPIPHELKEIDISSPSSTVENKHSRLILKEDKKRGWVLIGIE